MSTLRELNYLQRLRLELWLESYGVVLSHRMSHEYSDVLPVARLFNEVHPGRVDLHGYTPSSSVPLKANNWRIFNERVLEKMNMALTTKEQQQLAIGADMLLEALLHKLMLSDLKPRLQGGAQSY
ncbi:sperm flagellar protein 1-like [Drosophila madeirensis]|uniref:Sperm flagellar protein 1-like n=1 Tax=Drosophila madeirensis TaxID=30013 RepID=A0AAU9FYG5_DROMD